MRIKILVVETAKKNVSSRVERCRYTQWVTGHRSQEEDNYNVYDSFTYYTVFSCRCDITIYYYCTTVHDDTPVCDW